MRVAVAVRVAAVARIAAVGSSEFGGATLSSTTAERSCDGTCGEWQQEVAKLGKQLSVVVMASMVNGK